MEKGSENFKTYRNDHYNTDTEFVVYLARILLKPIGIWPLPECKSFFDRAIRFLYTRIVFTLLCIFLIPQLIYIFYDADSVMPYMKQLASVVYTVMAMIKFWAMIVNRKEVRYCLTKIEMQYRNVECEEDRLVMTNSARASRFYTMCYLGFSYGGGVPYHFILPLMSERIIRDDNTTRLLLPYATDYVFFVTDDSPIYEITFISQIFVSFIVLTIQCGTYSLIAALTMHSCCLFDVVSRKIQTTFEDNKEELPIRLKGSIRHHMQAIKYAETVEKSLSGVFLSEMLGNTLVICLCEFGIIMDWKNNETLSLVIYIVLLISIFFNVFVISLVGDQLKQVSEKVGKISYFTQWYNHPDEVANTIRMIMVRTNHPSSLTAAKVFDLSLGGFCDVCKTSAAYLNFLRAMTE